MKEKDQEVLERYRGGDPVRTICIDLGVSSSVVTRVARANGESRPKGPKPKPREPKPLKKGRPPGLPKANWPVCTIQGCSDIVRSRWGDFCPLHYFRIRRTGSPADRVLKGPSLTDKGYLISTRRGHPAAFKGGKLAEHRRVFYEEKGPDGHACIWCNKPLRWSNKIGDGLCVDHLNAKRSDNRIENLFPSCRRCNIQRGRFMIWLNDHAHNPALRSLFAAYLSDPDATGSLGM